MADNTNTNRNTGLQYGNSKTWVSQDAAIKQKWYQLEPRLARMLPVERVAVKKCPYVPRTLNEYIQHRKEYRELEVKRQKQLVVSKNLDLQAQANIVSTLNIPEYGINLSYPHHMDLAFNGKVLEFGCFEPDDSKYPAGFNPIICDPANRSAVLAQQSIWVVGDRHRVPWREEADWPSLQEMKWEGNQRIATEDGKFGRFMAVPREPAPGVQWNTVPFTKFYDLDKVWRIPDMEDIFAPIQDIDDVVVPELLNKSVLNAIDIPDDEL
jgi:hypothetical protein